MRAKGWIGGKGCRVAVAALTLFAAACSNKPPDNPEQYAARIASERAAKDAEFQRSDDVVPKDKKAQFLPLAYFPIDPEYHVLAALKPAQEQATLMMPTSSGQMRRMIRLGTLEFTLKGQLMSLSAFTEKDVDRLFVPFSDLTSATETYPAGRFLDLDRTGTNLYELDFNRAYIPYCYYNATYECPYPPAENRLKVPIRAGEKMKQ
jgi:uncharacterized protein (DUF1684 family)